MKKGEKTMNIYSLLNDVENREFATFYDQKLPETLETIENALSSDKANDEIDNLIKDFTDIISTVKVSDCLSKYLNEEKTDVFYYIGINDFVFDYYKDNPNSDWKIKAVLQCGFPFEFSDAKKNSNSNFSDKLLRIHLLNKKWSIFIFTKQPFSVVTLGFDDRNTYANLKNIRNQRQPDVNCQLDELPEDYNGNPFTAIDFYNEDHYGLLDNYLSNEKIPVLTNAEYQELKYSFTEIPAEYFRVDYLDYLSRYKKSVIDIFGYPKNDEKITKLKTIAEFVNAPGKKSVYPDEKTRRTHVFIKDFFFQNTNLKPTVRIGEQNIDYPTFWEEYEIKSYMKTISPYYLYCLLSSEFVSDYYSEHYDAENYCDSNTPLPLEDCIFIEMTSGSMCDKKYQEKYERDINPKTKAHAIITAQKFTNKNAKESIEKYLAEIKNDIDAGSFYSATILMGSVLEAFLIDWLCEIDGKDYFSEDYTVIDKRYNHPRRADLKDYIDEIQRKRPDWISGAKKATEIRKKRNLVHARLYIAEGEISQDICYEMLQNLEAIINNRWNK
jgi:hypothetical protein